MPVLTEPACEVFQEIKRLPTGLLVSRAAVGVEHFDRRVFDLSEEQLDQAFLPDAGPGVGTWPIRALLAHLADEEVAITHRVRRTLAEEGPMLAAFDENAFIDAGLHAGKGYAFATPDQHPALPIGGAVAVIYTLRRWNADLWSRLSPEQWERRAMHPEWGELTVRGMVDYVTWHLEHHARFLNRKIERFLGPIPDQPPAAAGCGPNCGCVGKR